MRRQYSKSWSRAARNAIGNNVRWTFIMHNVRSRIVDERTVETDEDPCPVSADKDLRITSDRLYFCNIREFTAMVFPCTGPETVTFQSLYLSVIAMNFFACSFPLLSKRRTLLSDVSTP
jgi:hypothetical protein